MKTLDTPSSIKSAKSLNSLKSTGRLNRFDDVANEVTTALQYFENLLPDTCMKLSCPYAILVKKDYQRDTYLKMLKQPEKRYKRNMITLRNDRSAKPTKEDEFVETVRSAVTVAECDTDAIVVNAIYDRMEHLTELRLSKVPAVPRVFMQTISLLAPHYPYLVKISICKSCINPYTLYELQKMLLYSNVSDIYLDGSTLLEANYFILLENASHLKNLSLSMCNINDEVCRRIANHLHFPTVGEKQLLLLNLSSNNITDVGAKYLAAALRTNRHLRYLNLAGNRIGDEGAFEILNMFMDFPLTTDEVLAKRSRYLQYLIAKRQLYSKYLSNIDDIQSSEDSSKKHDLKKRKRSKSLKGSLKSTQSSVLSESYIQTRAEIMATEAIGPFVDHFSNSNVKVMNEWSYCVGNLVLSYLNLAYNDLSLLSVRKLLEVLLHQSKILAVNQSGLLKVVIEGNRLPDSSPELTSIANLLQKNMMRCSGKPNPEGRRRSHTIGRISKVDAMRYPEKEK